MEQYRMGVLYVVATPIGNLADLSDRARDVLRLCPTIVAEDTRRTGQMLHGLSISARLISLNEHNASRRIEPILAALAEHDVALVSDAGTPTISDPGYQLVNEAHLQGYAVRSIPGPSAVIAALSVSGLPATPFTFCGYAPRGSGELASWIEDWSRSGKTTVFFEAPGRVQRTIAAIAAVDPDCRLVICRELTKVHEQVVRGSPAEINAMLKSAEIPVKGEFVFVTRGSDRADELDVTILLQARLDAGEGPNQAAKVVAAETGRTKSELYKIALELKADHSG
jgi:16S rRNA (cytidine1402-2'-O)-methyltransferase